MKIVEKKILSNNEINKRKYNGKKNVKGAFVKLNAGDVEHNVSMFNKGFGSPDGGNMTGGEGASGASAGGCCEGLEDAAEKSKIAMNSQEEHEKHGSHQKYKNWNSDSDKFVQDRYTPYVTTKRVKRTLDKMGYKPVEAYGIMMDIQKGHSEPRHVTLQSDDEGQTWDFRNEKGGRMFGLEEAMHDDGTFTVNGVPYDNIDEEVIKVLDKGNGFKLEDADMSVPIISWEQLMTNIVDILGYNDYMDIIDVAACIIAYLAQKGYEVDMKENNDFQLPAKAE